jgi:hypothetical protein
MRLLSALALLPLAACAAIPGRAPSSIPTDWRSVAAGNDRERLSEWRQAFTEALDKARKGGHGADIDREGALLDPDAAIGPVPIANGDYRCRVIKVGAKSDGLLNYIAYPAFRCRIEQDGRLQRFTKLTGSQRPVGWIYAGDALRQVFLGTLVLGDETQAMRYGSDQDRNVAGWVERIGDGRWRMVLPYPHFESTLDVIELIPAS